MCAVHVDLQWGSSGSLPEGSRSCPLANVSALGADRARLRSPGLDDVGDGAPWVRSVSTSATRARRSGTRWPVICDPFYTAATEQAARIALDEFAAKWGDQYPAIIRLWENAWAEFVPCLAYSPEIRKVIYRTNAIESVHARFAECPRQRPLPQRTEQP